jgi:hypothetical protein
MIAVNRFFLRRAKRELKGPVARTDGGPGNLLCLQGKSLPKLPPPPFSAMKMKEMIESAVCCELRALVDYAPAGRDHRRCLTWLPHLDPHAVE